MHARRLAHVHTHTHAHTHTHTEKSIHCRCIAFPCLINCLRGRLTSQTISHQVSMPTVWCIADCTDCETKAHWSAVYSVHYDTQTVWFAASLVDSRVVITILSCCVTHSHNTNSPTVATGLQTLHSGFSVEEVLVFKYTAHKQVCSPRHQWPQLESSPLLIKLGII